MAFAFSLATVLRFREILEDREERLLQKILFEIAQVKENLARTEAAIVGSDVSRREEVLKPLIGHDFQASYDALRALKQTKEELRATIGKLEQLKDRQLSAYETARRNREMLTDMRAEKRDAYEADLAQREQKTLDDNFIARRGRS
jgi:flagellar export protein FliJ